jgi:hypothetical protein
MKADDSRDLVELMADRAPCASGNIKSKWYRLSAFYYRTAFNRLKLIVPRHLASRSGSAHILDLVGKAVIHRQLLADAAKGHFYREAGRHILTTLCRDWLATADPQWEGILKGGVYHLHKNLGVNESVMWGEYFFLEALERALTAH